ncbi:MAG: hypothetical protein NTZ67_07980 [Gammaproteobacteria bacterium]|nr:hypothetical protein [Gammaproteobacteria bacterium]
MKNTSKKNLTKSQSTFSRDAKYTVNVDESLISGFEEENSTFIDSTLSVYPEKEQLIQRVQLRDLFENFRKPGSKYFKTAQYMPNFNINKK